MGHEWEAPRGVWGSGKVAGGFCRNNEIALLFPRLASLAALRGKPGVVIFRDTRVFHNRMHAKDLDMLVVRIPLKKDHFTICIIKATWRGYTVAKGLFIFPLPRVPL